MTNVRTTPSNEQPSEEERMATEARLLAIFAGLPAETKFWIRFSTLITCASGDCLQLGHDFGGRIEEAVAGDTLTSGLPCDRADAGWIHGFVEAAAATR